MSSNIEVAKVCDYCNQGFVAKKSITRYCSHKCNSAAYKQKLKEAKMRINEVQTAVKKVEPSIEIVMKPFYTIDDLSKLFGLSKRTFYRIIERGELPHVKLGGKTFVHKEAIEDLFKKKSNGN